ncbi:MAG: hypothetical protein ABSG45_05050 [Nitrososphaerales archaeon]
MTRRVQGPEARAATDIARRCKEGNEDENVLFNLSGHGLLDLKAYEDKMSVSLVDYSPDDATIKRDLESLPIVG